MLTDTWRKRLTYSVLSLFVAWHSLATIVAPMPDQSAAVQWVRSVLNPYLYFFRLDNRWSFFAPNVGKQAVFRYVVEDAAGIEHAFVPLHDRSSIPKYVMWREFKYLYDGIMEDPDSRVSIVALICQRHASLKPVAVSFEVLEELDFWPDDYLKGHRPLDPDFIKVTRMTNTAC